MDQPEDDDLDRLRRSLSAVRTIVIHMGEDLERMQAKRDGERARELLSEQGAHLEMVKRVYAGVAS